MNCVANSKKKQKEKNLCLQFQRNSFSCKYLSFDSQRVEKEKRENKKQNKI